MVPNERFLELLRDLEPSTTTTGRASAAHNAVRNHLWGKSSFKPHMVDDFLAGSWKRDTALRPQTIDGAIERPDVDIVIVTNYTINDAPLDVLTDLKKGLVDAFNFERLNKRSVHLIEPGAVMDVVPVIADGQRFRIPDRDTGAWLPTDPPFHAGWSQKQNERFDSRFKPLVKIGKWWRRHNPTGKRPKGFSNEVLMALYAPTQVAHFGEAFTVFLESIVKTYGPLAEMGSKPVIPDPALPFTNDILSKCTVPQWRDFIAKAKTHASWARRAQSINDMDEATELWRRIFPSFPATSTKAVSAYGYAAAAAPALTFPNVNATPPNAPREFA